MLILLSNIFLTQRYKCFFLKKDRVTGKYQNMDQADMPVEKASWLIISRVITVGP